jgi:hypothetical protein
MAIMGDGLIVKNSNHKGIIAAVISRSPDSNNRKNVNQHY